MDSNSNLNSDQITGEIVRQFKASGAFDQMRREIFAEITSQVRN